MAAKERIRVVVVDDHPIMRDGLRDALGGEESPRPCMECSQAAKPHLEDGSVYRTRWWS